MEKKSKLLTIGQFASLHGINKKTLMWYDQVGLFRPAWIHPENGYRYYSYHQSAVLETILLLRELDVSIKEIQEFMENRSAASLKCLLEHKILQKEERCLITVDINKDTSFEEEVEMITAETEKYQLGRLHHASYGSMIPVANLQNGSFHDYSKLFIEIPFLTLQNQKEPHDGPENNLHIQPGGKYLRAFHKGDWEKIPQRYQAILDHAQKKGLTLYGFSYEMGINENVIDQIEDYIVQIEIPILEEGSRYPA